MANEEKYFTTALFSKGGNFICDLLGTDEHIFLQMENIANLKGGKKIFSRVKVSDRFCLFRNIGSKSSLLFTAIIQ